MGASPHTGEHAECGSSAASSLAADDAAYAAALAALLHQVAHRPSLWERMWSILRRFHARRRDDGERLKPEDWFRMT